MERDGWTSHAPPMPPFVVVIAGNSNKYIVLDLSTPATISNRLGTFELSSPKGIQGLLVENEIFSGKFTHESRL